MTPEQKLSDIQKMALDFDKRLQPYVPEASRRGGCLFLGSFYAHSRRIFLGLNPGGDPGKFNVDLACDGYNPPFCNPERQQREHRYWRNCEKFLGHHSDLRAWFMGRVTSANLVPWRTANETELKRLNWRCEGKLYQYAGQLIVKMIEHHDAEILIVLAEKGVHLLNEIVKAATGLERGPWTLEEINKSREGPKGYPWRKLSMTISTRPAPVTCCRYRTFHVLRLPP